MLTYSHRISDRAAFEFYRMYESRLELYRAAAEWFYIIEAHTPDHLPEDMPVIVRRALPGKYASEAEGVAAVVVYADAVEQELRFQLEDWAREAAAEDLRERRTDPCDPLFWASAYAEDWTE